MSVVVFAEHRFYSQCNFIGFFGSRTGDMGIWLQGTIVKALLLLLLLQSSVSVPDASSCGLKQISWFHSYQVPSLLYYGTGHGVTHVDRTWKWSLNSYNTWARFWMSCVLWASHWKELCQLCLLPSSSGWAPLKSQHLHLRPQVSYNCGINPMQCDSLQ